MRKLMLVKKENANIKHVKFNTIAIANTPYYYGHSHCYYQHPWLLQTPNCYYKHLTDAVL